jgi:hypothetical protein
MPSEAAFPIGQRPCGESPRPHAFPIAGTPGPGRRGRGRFRERFCIALLLALTAISASCRQEISATPGVTQGPAAGETPGVTAAPAVEVAEPAVEEAARPAEPTSTLAATVDIAVASDPTDDAASKQQSDWLASLPTMAKNPLAGCKQCHVDVDHESIGSVHYDEKVGCTDCHGASEGHIADENNDVKPDEVFARENVDRLCSACHECFREEPAVAAPEAKVCTDCHGWHRVFVPSTPASGGD